MLNLTVEKLTNVKLPCKAHKTDAGIDFYMPESLEYVLAGGKGIKVSLADKVVNDETIKTLALYIEPHESVLIPMGVKLSFNNDYAMVFFNRSGTASKKHLFRGACVVDSGYTGQLFLNLTNVSNETQYLFPGEKLIQALLLPVPEVDIEEGKVDIHTDRGECGFGSSDHK